MTPVVFYRSTRSLVLVGLATIAFSMVGLFLPFQHPSTVSHAKLVVAGVAGLVFSLFCAVGWVRLWLHRHEPALVVDHLGFTDATRTVGVGRVDWSEVRGIRVVEQDRVRHVCVDLVDDEAFLARFSPRTAVLMRKNIELLGTPAAIAAAGLDRPFGEVVVTMESALAASRWSHGRAAV
ncbi:STM3941 family protein [Mobilicoccus pelagius]|uniref:Uncharacterized protein n=1 Tax=Mobilicoccus pelagius NBRC 104925 TaxID=1089455 RepID=H5UMD9_9MICO|nr:STM3941 family protein [Mobilicoccus pelagius]GAB46897.1 hypothetical protein MOPEL_001_00150 [Mobilicoccus pelagius NBRC 104925]